MISGSTNAVTATVNIGGFVTGTPAFDTANGNIYVPFAPSRTQLTQGSVIVISSATYSAIAAITTNVSPSNEISAALFDPGNGNIYVPGASSVSVISGSTNAVIATIGVGNAPGTPILDSSNGNIYVSNYNSSSVSVISPITDGILSTISVGSLPGTPTFDSLNGNIYVLDYGSGTVSTISGASNVVIATITIGNPPEPSQGNGPPIWFGPPVFNAANGNIYVPNFNTATVSVISGNSNSVVGTIDVGAGPVAGVFDPSNSNVYVSNSNFGQSPGSISVIATPATISVTNSTVTTTSSTISALTVSSAATSTTPITVTTTATKTITVTATVVATSSSITTTSTAPILSIVYVAVIASVIVAIVLLSSRIFSKRESVPASQPLEPKRSHRNRNSLAVIALVAVVLIAVGAGVVSQAPVSTSSVVAGGSQNSSTPPSTITSNTTRTTYQTTISSSTPPSMMTSSTTHTTNQTTTGSTQTSGQMVLVTGSFNTGDLTLTYTQIIFLSDTGQNFTTPTEPGANGLVVGSFSIYLPVNHQYLVSADYSQYSPACVALGGSQCTVTGQFSCNSLDLVTTETVVRIILSC